MIKLPDVTTDIKNQFYADLEDRFLELLENNSADPHYIKIIGYFYKADGTPDKEKIKNILVGEKPQLLNAIKTIGVISGNKVNDDFDLLYERFTDRKFGKNFAKSMGVTVCPYCNRSYIFTLENDSVRPQYDHFFLKSKYPYLAVSLFNLIPSCGICNQAKGTINTYNHLLKKETFIYLYEDEYGCEVKFKTSYDGDFTYWLGTSDKFGIYIDTTNATAAIKAKVESSKGQLKLEKLYEQHKDYIMNIIEKCRIYTDEHIFDLMSAFPALSDSTTNIKNLFFMNYLEKENWGKRILAKLTYDICKEFGT